MDEQALSKVKVSPVGTAVVDVNVLDGSPVYLRFHLGEGEDYIEVAARIGADGLLVTLAGVRGGSRGWASLKGAK